MRAILATLGLGSWDTLGELASEDSVPISQSRKPVAFSVSTI